MEHEVRELNPLQGIGQICLGSSEWLIENVTAIDQSLKELLLLIEHDAEFQLRGTDKKYQKHRKPLKLPELIARIKEMSNRSHELANYYQKMNGWNQLNNENEEYKKPGFNPLDQGMSSDVSLSTGSGLSGTAPNEDSEYSLASSDSDSESCNSSTAVVPSSLPPKKAEGVVQAGELEMLLKQFSNYEEKLRAYEEKHQLAENEIIQLKNKLRETEAALAKMGDLEVQLVTAENRIRLHEKELEKENMKSMMLQMKIVDLEATIESEKKRFDDLEVSKMKLKSELLERDDEVQRLKAELHDALGNFAMEKWQLETSVMTLSEQVKFHDLREQKLHSQYESLAATIMKYETEKLEQEKSQAAMKMRWDEESKLLKQEIETKNKLLRTMNADLNDSKLNHNMLEAEKDAIIQELHQDLLLHQEEIHRLKSNLDELHNEKLKLIAECDQANKTTGELNSKINMLQNEVADQAAVIADTAEGKREAIRQLCFSIDFFKSAYDELRSSTHGFLKKPTAMAF